ncbi:MAG: hypothetical protein A2068_00580 [Ignavibacteria bacterium GWB2_35_6b]|nr:MAG: hypothetical protein A2068_00580 [Ignavibacteria bacterium GWB2_35_6b]
MKNERYIWNEYITEYSLDQKIVDNRDIFLKLFEKKWELFFKDLPYNLCQLNTGNRLRPQIAYLGFMANGNDLNSANLDYIVDIGISIELIHKSSILIDDLIDNDVSRHNEPTFHLVHGKDKTILFAVYLISKAMDNLKNTLLFNKRTDSVFKKCIDLSIQTLHDMSLGALNEVSLTENTIFNSDHINQIIQLETGALIRNSLLIGYYSNEGCNHDVEESFEKIGNACGYIFQVMNDLEPFCNTRKYQLHKGTINADYFKSKKNIVVAFMYECLSEKEKRKFKSIDSSKHNDIQQLFFHYFEKYNILDCFMEEIDELAMKILHLIDEVNKYGINELWGKNFKNFVLILVKAAKNRLE